jgi:hypothetical protein
MMREAIGQVGTLHRLRKQAGNPAPEDELRRAGVLPNVARYHSVLWLEPGNAISRDLLERGRPQ